MPCAWNNPRANASGIGLTPCELSMVAVASLGEASAFEANEVMHKILVASNKFRWLLGRVTMRVSLTKLALVKPSVCNSRMLRYGRPRFLFVEVATSRLLIDEVEIISQLRLRDSSSELSKRLIDCFVVMLPSVWVKLLVHS